MKNFLLAFLPLICLSQTTKAPAAKPSTTDCPDFKNKAQVSKADYFESLRHTKKAQPAATAEKARMTKATPAVKAKPAAEKKSAVPKFSSSDDKIMQSKKPEPETKEVKEEKKTVTKPVTKPEPSAAESTKPKTEKKPAKKKEISYNSGKVKTSRKNTQKCPSF